MCRHFIPSLFLRFKRFESVIWPVCKVLLFIAYANSPFIHECAAIVCGSTAKYFDDKRKQKKAYVNGGTEGSVKITQMPRLA